MKFRKQPLNVVVFGQTDMGLVRKNNEDSFLMADLSKGVKKITAAALNHALGEKGSLFLVADGMGGASAGEVASLMAVEVVARRLAEELRKVRQVTRQAFVEALKKAVEDANAEIHHESRNNEECRGMGTTLTAGGVFDGAIFFAQVGDSRGYILRNGALSQMTKDQSLMAHLIALGTITAEGAKTHPQRNVILQALGVQEKVKVEVSFEELKKGDVAVICSDGLWGKLEPDELRELLKRAPTPQKACEELIKIARERGGEDNITVIVSKFDGGRLPSPARGEVPVGKPFTFDSEERQWRWRFWPWSRR